MTNILEQGLIDFQKEDISEFIQLEQIKENLTHGIKQIKTKQLLGNYLNKTHGVILRKNSHEIYMLDESSNGYNYMDLDDLIIELEEILGTENLVHTNFLEDSLGYISERLTPTQNIIKFNNCLYDIEQHNVIKPEKPIFTLIESKYNYNPEAKGKLIYDFLYSSLERETPEETEKAVKGVLQLIGYLFTNGNPLNILPIITGVSGGGKSVFGNIITAIFGSNRVADVKLHEIAKYTHATSSLANKTLNIIRDSSDDVIESNGLIKQLSGNEDMQINPKGKPAYILPANEVPKSILVCNNIPKFKKLEKALIDRFVVIEFKISFRNTERQDKNLENKLISNPEEIEALIFDSLQAYKEMVEKGEDFILKLGELETRVLVDKHENPLPYLVSKLILKHDHEAYLTELKLMNNQDVCVISSELNEAVRKLALLEGVNLETTKKGQVNNNKLMSAIKTEFELWDWYDENGKAYTTEVVKTGGTTKRVYPGLIKSSLYDEILK